MDTLEQARAEIDAVDAQLAALFERRMAAVLSVAQYKQAHGLPIFDAAREAVVLEKAAARIQNAALRPYYKDHVQNMMDVAKQYEAEVLGRNRAAYQGVEGAFAHLALRARCLRCPRLVLQPPRAVGGGRLRPAHLPEPARPARHPAGPAQARLQPSAGHRPE